MQSATDSAESAAPTVDLSLPLLQALNDEHNEAIQECITAKSVKAWIDNQVKVEQLVKSKLKLRPMPTTVTCLVFASACNDVSVVRSLVEAGADVSVTDSCGNTPLLLSVTKFEENDGDLEKIEYLLQCDASVVNVGDHGDRTPLHEAALKKTADLTNVLIQHGADVHASDNDKDTPLHLATQQGSTDAISALIQHGSDVHSLDLFGRTPLFNACFEGHVNIIHQLIRYGADVHARDSEMEATPLHIAAYKNQPDCVKALIEHGAAINATDSRGWTPLHSPAGLGHFATVKVLTSFPECDVRKKNNAGETAADLARKKGHDDIAKFLEKKRYGKEYFTVSDVSG